MKNQTKIKLKKAFNISFKGKPSRSIQSVEPSPMVGVIPDQFKFMKAKVIVNLNDQVKRGQALFYDKKNPQVYIHSPVSGTIASIQYGHQRRLECIEIQSSDKDDPLEFQSVDVTALSVSDVKSVLLERGLWPSFVEMPFHNMPNPNTTPPAIIVMLSNPEPFHPQLSVAIKDVEDHLIAGIQVLKKLTPNVVVIVDANEALNCDALSELTQVVRVDGDFSQFEPASILYHLKQSVDENKSWGCDWQSVVKIGATITLQRYYNQQWVSVGGNQTKDNQHYKVIEGVNVAAIVKKKNKRDRMIFGGLFTGLHTTTETYLPLGTDAINIIDSDPQPEFMSFVQPGANKPSFTTAYLSGFFNSFKKTQPSTALNGSSRDCISCGLCTDVCPVSLLPQQILRNVTGDDIESGMRHGLLDCSSCGVCTYVCPSKIDLASMFTLAKDTLYHEVTA